MALTNARALLELLELLEIDAPIIQAPMAGVSTPKLAAAVSNAGALGSIGVGATNAQGAREMIAAFRARSRRSLNVNVFCHAPARADLVFVLTDVNSHNAVHIARRGAAASRPAANRAPARLEPPGRLPHVARPEPRAGRAPRLVRLTPASVTCGAAPSRAARSRRR